MPSQFVHDQLTEVLEQIGPIATVLQAASRGLLAYERATPEALIGLRSLQGWLTQEMPGNESDDLFSTQQRLFEVQRVLLGSVGGGVQAHQIGTRAALGFLRSITGGINETLRPSHPSPTVSAVANEFIRPSRPSPAETAAANANRSSSPRNVPINRPPLSVSLPVDRSEQRRGPFADRNEEGPAHLVRRLREEVVEMPDGPMQPWSPIIQLSPRILDAAELSPLALPSPAYHLVDLGSSAPAAEEEDLPSCSICQEPYDTGDKPEIPLTLPCGHTFGSLCISQWLHVHTRRNGCPMCRAKFFRDRETVSPAQSAQVVNVLPPSVPRSQEIMDLATGTMTDSINGTITGQATRAYNPNWRTNMFGYDGPRMVTTAEEIDYALSFMPADRVNAQDRGILADVEMLDLENGIRTNTVTGEVVWQSAHRPSPNWRRNLGGYDGPSIVRTEEELNLVIEYVQRVQVEVSSTPVAEDVIEGGVQGRNAAAAERFEAFRE